jgi:predicted dehydrogenase
VGCGGRGLWIAKLFQAHGGYDLHAVADYFPAVAEAAGAALGVDAARRFSGLDGYRRLLDSGVEAVALETPPWFFPAHAAAATAAGKHVYMAKPVAVDVPGCLAIEAAARQNTAAGRVFLVDYQLPTDPHNLEVHRLIQAGELGELQMLDSHYYAGLFADPPLQETVASRFQQLVWVNDIALGGGYHVNACIHAVDAALWVAGRRPVAASGLSRRGRPDPHGDSDDVFAIVFEFEDGLIWTHRGKHLNNQTGFDVACQVQGRTGHAQLGYDRQAFLRGAENAYRGEVTNLYEAGAVRNIARFHECVTTGNAANDTVPRASDGALATILGREAARRKTRLTLAQLLAENQQLEVDLRGLKR